MMPDDLLRRYSAPQIAELMAYYQIKREDRETEDAQREIDAARTANR